MKITINSSTERKCRKFAEECVKTNHKYYSKARNQKNYKKIEEDIFIGKIAEFAVWLHLKKKPDPPDIEIYPSNKKTHSADLFCGDTKYHIKSCRKDREASWVYQPNCKYLYEDYHVYCIVDGLEVEIRYIISGEKLKEWEAYDDPYARHLIGKKIAVYHNYLRCVDAKDFIHKGEKNESIQSFR